MHVTAGAECGLPAQKGEAAESLVKKLATKNNSGNSGNSGKCLSGLMR